MQLSVVSASGTVAFGQFFSGFQDIQIKRAVPFWQRWRIKEWQHFLIVTPELLMSFAVIDAKYLQLALCQFVDRRSGQRLEHNRRGLCARAHLGPNLLDTHSRWHSPGFSIDIHNHLATAAHHIAIDIADTRHLPALQASLHCDASAAKALDVIMPIEGRRFMYSHKVPLPVGGSVKLGPRVYPIDSRNSVAFLDVHKAYYPHHTWWHWAAPAGFDAEGRIVAVNLTHNVVADDARYNENVLWVGGEPVSLGPARFLIPAKAGDPWTIRTLDDVVSLRFFPHGKRDENLNLGLARSVFQQYYGSFSGTVKFHGKIIPVDNLYGLCEAHDSLW